MEAEVAEIDWKSNYGTAQDNYECDNSQLDDLRK